MAYGFKCVNSNGALIVHANFSAFRFHSKITPSSSFVNPLQGNGSEQRGPLGRVFVYTATVTANSPVMPFLKQYSSYGASVIDMEWSGDTLTMYVLQETKSEGTGPTLYLFVDYKEHSTSGEYGMATYDSSGNKTFDTRSKPLRVTGMKQVYFPDEMIPGAGGTGRSNDNASVAPTSENTYSGLDQFGLNGSKADTLVYCPVLAYGLELEVDEDYSSTCTGLISGALSGIASFIGS